MYSFDHNYYFGHVMESLPQKMHKNALTFLITSDIKIYRSKDFFIPGYNAAKALILNPETSERALQGLAICLGCKSTFRDDLRAYDKEHGLNLTAKFKEKYPTAYEIFREYPPEPSFWQRWCPCLCGSTNSAMTPLLPKI